VEDNPVVPDKITVPRLKNFKAEGRRISMVTAYDYTFARLLEEAQVDMVLVGDSLGMVIQGRENTLSVTLDEMIYHAANVSRALKHSHLMVDMPFLSYQVSPEQALQNAGRLVKEAGAESVKIEGGLEQVVTVRKLVQAGIPVMAHIGLRPQNIHVMGGYVVQGRKPEMGRQLLQEAKAHEDAGAFSLLLEGVPETVAREITQNVKIPTIGIGAGPACDGQVLVIYDLLGLDKNFNPKFARKYAHLHEVVVESLQKFQEEVREGQFPAQEHSY
jgi:3-methyl-2-oxobutanoate hydroxymethyltransferase